MSLTAQYSVRFKMRCLFVKMIAFSFMIVPILPFFFFFFWLKKEEEFQKESRNDFFLITRANDKGKLDFHN